MDGQQLDDQCPAPIFTKRGRGEPHRCFCQNISAEITQKGINHRTLDLTGARFDRTVAGEANAHFSFVV